jgi:hypothetical protein
MKTTEEIFTEIMTRVMPGEVIDGVFVPKMECDIVRVLMYDGDEMIKYID